MLSPLTPALTAGHLVRTRSGRSTVTRQADASDLAGVNAMHGRCSAHTLVSRYQTVRSALREREWAHLVRPGQGVSWVTSPADRPGAVVAVAHLLHTDDDHRGELALLVEDDWQEAGLGTALTRLALARAASLGMHGVRVFTTPANRRMIAICRALGARTPAFAGPATEGDGFDLLVLPVPGPVTRLGGRPEDDRVPA
jgi:RimJ/RimL family protein N-acetyltransferase